MFIMEIHSVSRKAECVDQGVHFLTHLAQRVTEIKRYAKTKTKTPRYAKH